MKEVKTVAVYTCDHCNHTERVDGEGIPDQWVTVYERHYCWTCFARVLEQNKVGVSFVNANKSRSPYSVVALHGLVYDPNVRKLLPIVKKVCPLCGEPEAITCLPVGGASPIVIWCANCKVKCEVVLKEVCLSNKKGE